MNRPGENKPQLHRIPPYLVEIAYVLDHGAQRHGEDDWKREELDPVLFLDAGWRHMEEIRAGRLIDPHSGRPHAAHWAVDAMIFGVKTEREAQAQAQIKWTPKDGESHELRDVLGGGS